MLPPNAREATLSRCGTFTMPYDPRPARGLDMAWLPAGCISDGERQDQRLAGRAREGQVNAVDQLAKA